MIQLFSINDFNILWALIGGDGGIRTLDRALGPYNGLANRRLQPLGHVSGRVMPSGLARSGQRSLAPRIGARRWSDGRSARAACVERGGRVGPNELRGRIGAARKSAAVSAATRRYATRSRAAFS